MNTLEELERKFKRDWEFRFWYAVYWPLHQLARLKYRLKKDSDMDVKDSSDVVNAEVVKTYFFKTIACEDRNLIGAVKGRLTGHVSAANHMDAHAQARAKSRAAFDFPVYVYVDELRLVD